MTDMRPQRLVFFAIYGLVLFVAGGLLTRLLDGPLFALAVFSSPLSVWRGTGLLGTLVFWPIIGLLLAYEKRTLAIALIAVHYAAIPFGVSANLRAWNFNDDWSLFSREFSAGDFLLWLPYFVGQVVFWRIVLRRSDYVRAPSNT